MNELGVLLASSRARATAPAIPSAAGVRMISAPYARSTWRRSRLMSSGITHTQRYPRTAAIMAGLGEIAAPQGKGQRPRRRRRRAGNGTDDFAFGRLELGAMRRWIAGSKTERHELLDHVTAHLEPAHDFLTQVTPLAEAHCDLL